MKLLTVILNYKVADMALKAAEALMAATEALPDARLVIVDNDSQDGSFEKLRDAVASRPWRSRAEVLQSGHNGGFGAGNNFGIRRNLASSDKADYYYILNPDAFPSTDAVTRLVDFLDNHRYVGIAGSYIEGPDGVPHHTAFRFPSLVAELEAGLGFGPASKLLKDWIVALPMPERTTQVDWLAGASMMIRRQVLEQVGLFDETFFLYFEETDLCRRALLAGWPTYYVKDSVVVHVGSATTGMKDKARPMPRFWFDSRKHYFEKHHGPTYLKASNVAWAAGHMLWQVRKVIQRKPDPHPPGLLKDFLKHNFLAWRARARTGPR